MTSCGFSFSMHYAHIISFKIHEFKQNTVEMKFDYRTMRTIVTERQKAAKSELL